MGKIAKTVGAIALLLAGLAILVHMVNRSGVPAPPDAVLNRVLVKIDSKSLQVYESTAGEWMKLGKKNGYFRNPDTGEYTITERIQCSECGKDIPAPVLDGKSVDKPPSVAMDEALAAYACPHCGKTQRPGRGGPPR